jgi:hypothetical protein
VSDALAVLDVVDMSALEGEARDAVGLLALVAGQDVEPGDHEGTWRIARRTAPDRVISTVDPDSRYVHKTVRSYRDGYKAHIVVEPVTGLICGQQLTAGNAPDGPTGVELMANEPAARQVLARLRLRVRRDTGRAAPPKAPARHQGSSRLDEFVVVGTEVRRTAALTDRATGLTSGKRR